MNPLRFCIAFVLACTLTAVFSKAANHDWPQWRGPLRTGHAMAGSRVPEHLPDQPKVIWRIKSGEGHSGLIVASGRLIYTGAEGEIEVVYVLDANTGKELWKQPYAQLYRDEWGAGPRATPISDIDRLYIQSCRGDFCCFQLADGKLIWKTNFEKDFGVKFLGSKANEGTASRRGNNGTSIVDGNAVIVPVGATNGASLVCFDKLEGKVLRKCGEDEAAYSSLMVATLDGVKQVLHFNAEALVGVDRETGRLLWRVPLKTNAKRHAATPVIIGDHVLVNSHTFGMICFNIAKERGEWKATESWHNNDLKINLATPVVVGDYIYSHGANKDFLCVGARSGELKWSREGFGEQYSSTIAIADKLLVLADTGQLVLIAADPSAYRELGRTQVCGKTWSFPAFAGGKLFVRDARQLTCFDLLNPQ